MDAFSEIQDLIRQVTGIGLNEIIMKVPCEIIDPEEGPGEVTGKVSFRVINTDLPPDEELGGEGEIKYLTVSQGNALIELAQKFAPLLGGAVA